MYCRVLVQLDRRKESESLSVLVARRFAEVRRVLFGGSTRGHVEQRFLNLLNGVDAFTDVMVWLAPTNL